MIHVMTTPDSLVKSLILIFNPLYLGLMVYLDRNMTQLKYQEMISYRFIKHQLLE